MSCSNSTSFTLRARWVLTMAGPPIDGGYVTIDHDRIVSVERRHSVFPCHDLGDVALLPGLINAHAHLDLSDADKPFGQPGMNFVEWLGQVMLHKQQNPTSVDTVRKGLCESVRVGTTTLVDIAQQTPLDLINSLNIELISLLELIAPSAERVVEQIRQAESHLAAANREQGWSPGLSPHAPYSVTPDLLARAVAMSAEHHVPLAMHLAESLEEMELLAHRRGPFRDFLERLGIWNDASFPAGLSVLDYLRTLAGAHRTLVIHSNYLGNQDMAFLAERADRMAVVYCPRTHTFFGHDAYPLEVMLAAGVRVALGTDSRGSSPDLSVLAELREAHRRHPSLSPEAIVRLATADAAAALGRSHELGTIEPGRRADLVAVALPNDGRADSADPYRQLLETDAPVEATWYRGQALINE